MENKPCRISDNPRKLPFKLIEKITNFFSEERKLGQGAFGQVYKGVLEDGEEIAVKILHSVHGIDGQQFQNEFENLKRLNHPNIVRLVGFCDETEEVVVPHEGKQVPCEKIHRALCLEYVPNGSLGKLLATEYLGNNWSMRYKIIKGICEGLKYLHEGLEVPTLHLDLKPDNILLDGEMVPKIADFGLSRLVGEENTIRTMTPLGTLGYLPPEFITNQIISKEYDIFSLGVVITKIMTGIIGYSIIVDMEPPDFIEHVYNNWRTTLQEIPRYASFEAHCKQVKRCIEIAINCMDKDRRKRPLMKDIISKLDEIGNKENNLVLQIEKFHKSEPIIIPSNTLGRPSPGNDEVSRRKNTGSRKNDPSGIVFHLPFHLLKEITRGFTMKVRVGSGRSSLFYKGVLKNGKEISVRSFDDVVLAVDDIRFQNEIQTLMRLHHHNIMQLVGYCHETERMLVEFNGKIGTTENVNRVICLECMQNGSLEEYISDESPALDWHLCYKIIKGTCEGLRYLHMGFEEPIYHLDLKPDNILLDKNMEPKITEFYLPRLIGEEQIKLIALSSVEATEYMPPEYKERDLISGKFDIFSLGIIIMKMIAGHNGYSKRAAMDLPDFTELVLGIWRKRLEATCGGMSLEGYCQQVKQCIEIAFECVEYDRHKRPNIWDIVRRLEETETVIHGEDDPKLFRVHPLQLCFPFDPRRASCCSLQLNNKGDDCIAFRLLTKSTRRYFTKWPLCGIVPPRCTYTVSLTMRKQRPPLDSDEAFILQSVLVRDQDLKNLDQQSIVAEFDQFIKKAEETLSDKVQKVVLKVVCDPPSQQATSEPTEPAMKIIVAPNAHHVLSIEVHPTEPWIMTTHRGGNLRVWNYQTMAILNLFEITDEPVYVAKFVAHEKWIMAGDDNGYVHVYSYDECKGVTSFEAHDCRIESLAVHPTDPYVLSSSQSDNNLIKLWHWDKEQDSEHGWWCTRTFEGHSDKVSQVIFNPEDSGSFASASWDGTVKIWGINSGLCDTITLDEHPDSKLIVDYVTGGVWQHLITGSMDGTAQIWDLRTKGWFKKPTGHVQHLSAIYCHPELPTVITGSLDGTVRTWDSITYRLENIIDFNLGAVNAFRYIKGSQR